MPVTGTPASTVLSTVSSEGNTRGRGPMKPSLLELLGEPPIKWTVWVAIFSDHLLACDLDSIIEARKLAVSCSSLGAEGYRICFDLCLKANVTINTKLIRLGIRFASKVSVIYVRPVFHRRR